MVSHNFSNNSTIAYTFLQLLESYFSLSYGMV